MLFDEVRSGATVEERQRLAREIHDGVAQDISSLGYMVDDLARVTAAPPALKELRAQITRIVSELRISIYDLHDGTTTDVGLGATISALVQDVGRSGALKVHFALEESDQRLRLDVETELLKIAQEAIVNARQHSRASNLWITCLVAPPRAEVRVEDDGVGGSVMRSGHYGLRIMHERANRINARLTVADRPGGGTAVAVTVGANSNQAADLGEPRELYRLAR
jgi:signal transduction histidine kinase